jgi:acetylglutamate kinase
MTRRVIKVGGRPQLDAALIGALARAHCAMQDHDAPDGGMILVHGGGDEISTLQRLYGVTEIIRMALSGSANKRLVSALVSEGVPAVGLSGEDAGLLVADPLDPEQFGYVGTPSVVNASFLGMLLDNHFLPVLSPVSRCSDPTLGATLNVNGDDAAAAIAVAMKATELLLVSDVAGVLQDGQPIAMLAPEDVQKLIDDGTAQGGMAAKLQAAMRALDGGVERVRISDIAAIEQFDRGTVLTRVGSVCA